MNESAERRDRAVEAQIEVGGERGPDGYWWNSEDIREAFLAGCDWQHKTTIADVVAWLRKRNFGRLFADAIERGEAKGASEAPQ